MSEPKTWRTHGGEVKTAEQRDFSTVISTAELVFSFCFFFDIDKCFFFFNRISCKIYLIF